MYMDNSTYLSDIKKIIPVAAGFKNKKLFITGSSGLIVSFLIDTLMYLNKFENYNTHIYATFLSENELNDRFSNYANEEYFHPIIQDITKEFHLDMDADFIIHAASITHPFLYNTKPVETMMLNITGTKNVWDYAKSCSNARCLFLSTFEVYGEINQDKSLTENDIGILNFTIPRSCYPESKRACETLCASYIKEYGLSIMTVRLGYIYGPTVQLASSKADVQFLNNALNKEDIILKSTGEQKRSYCYVADVVSGMMTVLLNGENGEAYNISNSKESFSLKDFATKLAALADVKLTFDIPVDENPKNTFVSNSIISSDKLESLGWKAVFSADEGITHTYQIKKDLMSC